MRKAFCLLLTALLACSAFPAFAEAPDDSLAALAEPYGFKVGGVISYAGLRDAAYLALLKRDFNSITPGNELKAYSLLDQFACQRSADGMPAMRYDQADALLQFAKDNGIAVRGHVLVWDAYMPDYFFREGYQNSTPFVSADVMKTRLQSYIKQVVTHFETSFPGVIYCWDVVNEAIADSAAEWSSADERHIRTSRSGVDNLFFQVLGADYIALSFLYAKDTLERCGSSVKLFYNDYNAFYPQKRDSIIALVESINSFATDAQGNARKLCDGVGMQGYIGGYGTQDGRLNEADLDRIETAMQAYAALGLEVQVTEMAVRAYVNDDATMQKHAAFYAELFRRFVSVNSGEAKPLTAVTIWGLVDCPSLPREHYSYKLNSPYGGLFAEDYAEKSALTSVRDALRQR